MGLQSKNNNNKIKKENNTEHQYQFKNWG
jgi:hypothetical protein